MKKQKKTKKVKKEDKGVEEILKEQRILFYVLGVALALVVIYFAFSYFVKEINNFEYEGLAFSIERNGNIPLYKYFYYYTAKNGQLIKYNLYLKIDPRENNVPVEVNNIYFPEGKFVYISVNSTNLQQCSGSASAIADLGSFLRDNQFTVRTATPDEKRAEQVEGLRYATCETNPENPVIYIHEGEESIITNPSGYCYDLSVSNCEVLKVIEKFRVQTILDAKSG